jgi:hypothetical protein
MLSPEHACVVCSGPITAKRSDAKTCSARCRQRLSRGRLERNHPKYSRAWPEKQASAPRHYEQPPEAPVGDPECHGPEVLLFDLAMEIRDSFDKTTGLDRRRRRMALKRYAEILEGIAGYCVGNGVGPNLVNEILRVARAIHDTTNQQEEYMDTQAVIDAVTAVVREEHEKTRHEIVLVQVKLQTGETPAEAADRILAETDRGDAA